MSAGVTLILIYDVLILSRLQLSSAVSLSLGPDRTLQTSITPQAAIKDSQMTMTMKKIEYIKQAFNIHHGKETTRMQQS